MATLENLFKDLQAAAQGDVTALSRATREYANSVTSKTSRKPRDASTSSASAVGKKKEKTPLADSDFPS